MNLSLLQRILITSAFLLLYMIIDARRRRRLRIFHTLVFVWWITAILIVSFNQQVLQQLWWIVGVEKWSDFLVYISIIVLSFWFFSLLQHLLQQQQELTRLCTGQALREYKLWRWTLSLDKHSNTEKSKYLFLIRAYNEGSVLWSVIDEILAAWFDHIAIVNDWSKDNTEEVINQAIEQYKGKSVIVWLHHPINRWPWAANKTLFAFASRYAKELGCERCVTYDADGQMSIEDMDTFMTYANHKSYDIIIGSRFVKGASTENMPAIRRVILRWARIITYIFNGLRVTDVPTGYRMYHVNSISKIQLISDWFSYQNDIIESIRRHQLKFIEIPVHIKYTEYSLKKWQSNLSAFKILVRLIYSSLFSR